MGCETDGCRKRRNGRIVILQEGVDLAGEACSQKDSFKLTRVGVGAQFVY